MKQFITTLVFSIMFMASALVHASSNNFSLDLPYPENTEHLSAEEIIRHTWFVNHFRAVKNYAIKQVGNEITWIAYRNHRGKYRFRTLERFLKNEQDKDTEIFSRDMVVFHYPGAIDGTGILITDFADADKSQSLTVWLPALRKPRRFAQPAHDDAYAGTDWTYGDVALRKPWHESHELLREESFSNAEGGSRLHTIEVDPEYQKSFMSGLPTQQELTIDRPCYVVKSTTHFRNFWYDYRVSWIDKTTFADYRTLYYKNGKQIKLVDRLWKPMQGHSNSNGVMDPRAQYWVMWYGKTEQTGHETMAIIPEASNFWNIDLDDSHWSINTLEKIKR